MLTLLLRLVANGDLWIGASLSTIAIALLDAAGALDRRPRTARAAGFVFLLLGALGALGAPPLPLPLALALVLSIGAHAFFGFHHVRPRVRGAGALVFVVFAALALALDLPYVIGPAFPSGPPPRSLVVLGDSLTAGGYGEARTWPRILAEEDHLEVRDLSRDGQTVAKALDALEAAKGAVDGDVFGDGLGNVLPPAARGGLEDSHRSDPGDRLVAPPSRDASEERSKAGSAPSTGIAGARGDTRLAADPTWVLIELGGNDVLGESTLSAYETSLDRLLMLCRGDPLRPRTVVMLEIPAVPGRWGFAAAQRRLAARHGAILVPRRVLANAVFARGSTSADPLHLTQCGQQRVADALRPWLALGTTYRAGS